MNYIGATTDDSKIRFTVTVEIADSYVVSKACRALEWAVENLGEGAGSRSQEHKKVTGVAADNNQVSFIVVVEICCFDRSGLESNRDARGVKCIGGEPAGAIIHENRNF